MEESRVMRKQGTAAIRKSLRISMGCAAHVINYLTPLRRRCQRVVYLPYSFRRLWRNSKKERRRDECVHSAFVVQNDPLRRELIGDIHVVAVLLCGILDFQLLLGSCSHLFPFPNHRLARGVTSISYSFPSPFSSAFLFSSFCCDSPSVTSLSGFFPPFLPTFPCK